MADIATIQNVSVNFFTSIYSGYEANLISLATYTVAMVIYAIVIWHFYRNLAKRDLFKGMEQSGKASYVLKYLIVFPVISSAWFLLLSVFFFFLAKSYAVETVLLVSITLVSAVRAASYYNEDLSKDLAKMIPFALLGIFIIDSSYFSMALVIERIMTFPSLFQLIARYILFVFVLELILRTIHGIRYHGKDKE